MYVIYVIYIIIYIYIYVYIYYTYMCIYIYMYIYIYIYKVQALENQSIGNFSYYNQCSFKKNKTQLISVKSN